MAEKTVLGGYMSSRKNNKVGGGDELFCLRFVLSVKESIVGEYKSACFKASLYSVAMPLCEIMVIFGGTDKEATNG